MKVDVRIVRGDDLYFSVLQCSPKYLREFFQNWLDIAVRVKPAHSFAAPHVMNVRPLFDHFRFQTRLDNGTAALHCQFSITSKQQ